MVNVGYRSRKLEKQCSIEKEAVRTFGKQMADAVRAAIEDFEAAENLAVMATFPQYHCEELRGKRSGELSIVLVEPYRLVFFPLENPLPKKPDGGLDWSLVRNVRVKEVIDYHGQGKRQ
jgi:plasmid maintenance system killer protein